MTRSLPKTRKNPASRLSVKLASLMRFPVVGFHQGQRRHNLCTNRPDIRSKPTKSFKMSKSACHQRPSTYDDWGLAPITGEQRRDLLEVVDDRHQRGSTIITSQVPIENWHEIIADPTIADAVLDRLVHNAHRLILKGDSMRKITAQRANLDAAKKT
ncbi:hypothetical protein ACVWZV_008991 [Bradyrhizobium sp. GM5.1]